MARGRRTKARPADARTRLIQRLASICLPVWMALCGCQAGPGSHFVDDQAEGGAADLAGEAGETDFAWRLPLGFGPPPVPEADPMSADKVELGRRLFYDPRLSGNGTQSCASCHQQARAFTDGRARALGSTGELHPRSAMSLANVGYETPLGWADPALESLEAQARVPLLNQMPIEMGVFGREAEVLGRLSGDPRYAELFERAFGASATAPSLDHVARALAAFERTLVSGDSPYDRLLFRDDRSALSASALRGMKLFFSSRLRCSECHAGLLFRAPPGASFQNTALYDVDGRGGYPAPNEGAFRATGRARDMGRFKVPTLRNVAVTAPYMHDGSVPTLDAVLDHYASGGRAAGNRFKSERISGFALSPAERADVVAFLESLTDRTFLSDPRFANPFLEDPAPTGPDRGAGPE